MSKKKKIETYYVTHTITIVQEIPARSKDDAIEQMDAMMQDRHVRAALTKEDCTSSSTTSWEVVARDAYEQDEHEQDDFDSNE